jgi:hypothetical protein
MFQHGDLVLIILAGLSIISVWPMVFFRKSTSAAWIGLAGLIYLAAFCFKVLNHMEFYGWGYVILAGLTVVRLRMIERLKEIDNA